jgi:hypothetical protein
MSRRPVLALALALVVALTLPAMARSGDGDDARVTGSCSGRSDATLRLRSDDGAIRVELRIDTGRRGALWRVIVLHERRIAFRAPLRTSRSSGSLRLRRNVSDWFGSDTIAVRATGPRGETCRASATI